MKRPGSDRYGVAKVMHQDGTKFDSKKELKRYDELRLLVRAKVIDCLTLQCRIAIEINGTPIKYFIKTGRRRMFYVADFHYYDREKREWIFEDVKGHKTEVYKIKKALLDAMGITITET